MIKKSFLVYSIISIISLTGCNQEKKMDKASLSSEDDKMSYAIGFDMGRNLKKQGVNLNLDAIKEGIKNSFKGEEALMTEDEIKKTFETASKKIMEKQQKDAKEAGEKNVKEGKEFLDKKKKEDGVKETSSGLLYKVLKEGTGKQAKLSDEVTVHYKGTLISGKEFDSSYKRKEPTTFPLKNVIKGWQEGVQLMNEGAKFEFYIKPELAYGDKQAGADITANSTLVFEVELIKIK